MKLIDLSHLINNKISVYPGDDEVKLTKTKSLSKDGYNNSNLNISMHVGTHIDGPMHLTSSNTHINEFDLSKFYGNGFLIDATNTNTITIKEEFYKINKEDIVLIYTGFDKLYGTNDYYHNHPIITKDLAELLISKQIKMVGIDCPSPDGFPFEIHKMFLSNNILIIENLTNLDKLLDTKFEIMAFPIKIEADSALVRAVAKIIE